MFHMTILGKHDWYLPTQKVAQQKLAVAGVLRCARFPWQRYKRQDRKLVL